MADACDHAAVHRRIDLLLDQLWEGGVRIHQARARHDTLTYDTTTVCSTVLTFPPPTSMK